ncbi:MAG: hypothetical protein KGI25_06770 [Thaumarchaeota archaeon]|nr:hypothetical protein [Nitrososphaerota archaeon]
METRIRGTPKFVKFYNDLPKISDLYREIDSALDMIKEDSECGDKIQRQYLLPSLYPYYEMSHPHVSCTRLEFNFLCKYDIEDHITLCLIKTTDIFATIF